jgi:hypothetical protein
LARIAFVERGSGVPALEDIELEVVRLLKDLSHSCSLAAKLSCVITVSVRGPVLA